MQEFKHTKKHTVVIKGTLVALIVILCFMLGITFGEENDEVTSFILIACIAVIAFFTIQTWSTLKKLPNVDIVTDDDGIWYKYLGKDQGLIPWGKISKISERTMAQCLYLSSPDGTKLLRVEYQLTNFDVLRCILCEKINTKTSELEYSTFTKGWLHHLYFFCFIIILFSLGLYFSISGGNRYFEYGGIIFLFVICTHEYVFTAYSVHINNTSLEICYPTGKKRVQFSDVTNLYITDEFENGYRLPEIWIISNKYKKPFKLKKLGVDSSLLFIALRNALTKHSH